MSTTERAAEKSARTDVASRPRPAARGERVTAWIGWRLPELVGVGGTGLAGALHWPGWWVATAAALGWITWIQTAPLIRRVRTRRAARTDRPATDPTSTPELDETARPRRGEETG